VTWPAETWHRILDAIERLQAKGAGRNRSLGAGKSAGSGLLVYATACVMGIGDLTSLT
jgi:hypothetical protein